MLAKIERLTLLSHLYNNVLLPFAVMAELKAKPDSAVQQVEALIQAGSFQVRQATKKALNRIPPELGEGERETIALALQIGADLVLLDDQEGRRIARKVALPVSGTIGVLIEAVERELIFSIRPELDRLVEAGMWLDERFYHRLLQEFGE
jgi:uncharacterized protein